MKPLRALFAASLLTGNFVSAWVVLTVTAVAMLVVTRVFSPATYRTAPAL